MKDEWTVDNGLLTPTLKVKRHNLEEHYEGLINGQLSGKIARQ
jgi:long-subunit acyl-CoA synthetase (AMP-forming)